MVCHTPSRFCHTLSIFPASPDNATRSTTRRSIHTQSSRQNNCAYICRSSDNPQPKTRRPRRPPTLSLARPRRKLRNTTGLSIEEVRSTARCPRSRTAPAARSETRRVSIDTEGKYRDGGGKRVSRRGARICAGRDSGV